MLHNDIFLADYRTTFEYPTSEILKDLAGVSSLDGTILKQAIQKLNGNDLHASFSLQDQ